MNVRKKLRKLKLKLYLNWFNLVLTDDDNLRNRRVTGVVCHLSGNYSVIDENLTESWQTPLTGSNWNTVFWLWNVRMLVVVVVVLANQSNIPILMTMMTKAIFLLKSHTFYPVSYRLWLLQHSLFSTAQRQIIVRCIKMIVNQWK